ncbi:MAG: RagB/SusD family nutrient uptake outer membrane protein, partial [Bacteroidetes bacterium]|nr:RagB/SusD family nutrient uptake outer membrane protein [Bacteroidota bacterium]
MKIHKLLKQGKMKIYRISSLILILTILSSCDDFLSVDPLDRIDGSTFFANQDQMIIGINGVYAAHRGVYTTTDAGSIMMYTLQESRSDNSGMDHTDQGERVETDLFNEGTGNLPISGLWETMYRGINLANKVVASAATAEGDQAVLGRIAAEAKFLRAHIYFQMVNIWGGVPIRTEPTEDFSSTILPRASVSEVYAVIIQDLTEAAGGLPTSYSGGAGAEVGRVTSYAALTLLGKVQLQNGNAPAAEAALRQVLGEYTLLGDFADIHAPGNDNTAESIFEVSFNPANQTGMGFNNNFIPSVVASDLGILAGGSNRTFLSAYPTQDLVDSFDPTDLRIPSTFGRTTTGNYIGPYISKFIDPAAASAGSDINFVVLRYADVLLMLAEAIGEGGEAYDLINEVRTRAGLPDIDAASPGTFMEKIMNERRWEFAFEIHRWIDLQRLPDADIISIMETQL